MNELLSIGVTGCFKSENSEFKSTSNVDIHRWIRDANLIRFEYDARTRDRNRVDRAV